MGGGRKSVRLKRKERENKERNERKREKGGKEGEEGDRRFLPPIYGVPTVRIR